MLQSLLINFSIKLRVNYIIIAFLISAVQCKIPGGHTASPDIHASSPQDEETAGKYMISQKLYIVLIN